MESCDLCVCEAAWTNGKHFSVCTAGPLMSSRDNNKKKHRCEGLVNGIAPVGNWLHMNSKSRSASFEAPHTESIVAERRRVNDPGAVSRLQAMS